MDDVNARLEESIVEISRKQFEKFLQLETFFNCTPDLLCIAGFDGYFKRINPAVANLLEFTEEELLQHPIQSFIYADDILITKTERDKLKDGQRLLNFENRYITKTGKIIWLSWTSILASDKNHIYAIAKNVTTKKKLEEEKNTLLNEIAKANQDLKHFARATSHDLRSPINNLIALFELLDTEKITDEETKQFVQILQSSTYQLKTTFDNYVEDLKSKDGLFVSKETLILDDVLTKVLGSVQHLLNQAHAKVEINFSAFSNVYFNKTYLESIFLNLITNAIKYAKADDYPLINIYTQVENQIKQIIIQDNGIGFDADKVKDKIFRIHQTFHNHPDAKGIGLYLVHTHVLEMGAKITVHSEINKGTTFKIHLGN
ncbi:sensor histidine kinase [Pedobacter glucosidilyticus]|uniref:sensor histidine kinase n=1 Tax=Pedobacter glucosidilyticus TaxID=1122941 RepID=UPI0026ED7D68|nr:PAS domain-containing sensor histidine kinase [Pedobacter glucosidilyticus]